MLLEPAALLHQVSSGDRRGSGDSAAAGAAAEQLQLQLLSLLLQLPPSRRAHCRCWCSLQHVPIRVAIQEVALVLPEAVVPAAILAGPLAVGGALLHSLGVLVSALTNWEQLLRRGMRGDGLGMHQRGEHMIWTSNFEMPSACLRERPRRRRQVAIGVAVEEVALVVAKAIDPIALLASPLGIGRAL